ncbi:MAG: DUF2812 domain-containing protein [Bacillota bacterium]|nr:DUF2812 domain-containing protein [Bacillota bacterium]
MKLIREMIPVNIYDIAKTQSYLSDMASKGYFLKKLSTFAYFEKGEPEETTYRLDPLMRNEKKPKYEQLAHYESYGWEYVCTITKGFHVYKTNKKDYTEIHTDPITQSYAFDYLNKNLKFSYIISIVMLPLAAFMILYSVFLHNHPVLYAVKYGNVTNKIMVLLLAFITVKQVMNNRKKINLLLDRLKIGSEMPQKSSYKLNYSTYIFNGLLTFLAILSIIISIYTITADWEMNLSEFNKSTPTIQLNEIETSQNFEINNDGYKSNHISYDWGELAPDIYEINERGFVKGQMWEDQSGEYSPSLSTEFYRLRFGFLGESMLEDLVDNALEFFRFRPIVYQELLNTDFDEAVFIKVEETQMLFALLDKKVIYVRYHGYEDLSEHFNEIYKNARNF